jgi:cytochrome d ubiquinol oxidase subunit I
VPFAFAAVAAVCQPLVGHLIGDRLQEAQPSKLAAMELATETEDHAPLVIGGVLVDGEVKYGITIPDIGSLIATGSFDGVITGFDQIPDAEQPPANVVHLAFQTMVAAGFAMVGLVGWWLVRRRRHRDHPDGVFDSQWFLRAAAAAGPVAVIALQAGWVTTEVGRQPWIVYGIMRVDEAVTSNSGIWYSLAAMIIVYAGMAVMATKVLRGMARRWRESGSSVDLPTPYGPDGDLVSTSDGSVRDRS